MNSAAFCPWLIQRLNCTQFVREVIPKPSDSAIRTSEAQHGQHFDPETQFTVFCCFIFSDFLSSLRLMTVVVVTKKN